MFIRVLCLLEGEKWRKIAQSDKSTIVNYSMFIRELKVKYDYENEYEYDSS